MSTTEQTFRRRTAAELKQRPTRDLLRDIGKLRGRLQRDDLTAEDRARANEDIRLIDRELSGRTRGKQQ